MTLKLDRIIDWKVSKEKKPLTSNYFQVHIKVEIRAVKCYDKKRRYISVWLMKIKHFVIAFKSGFEMEA